MEPIGVIGLGLMGRELAGRFLAGGLRVVGFDLREACREQLVASGGVAVRSIRDVFQECRVVVLSLPNSDVVADGLTEATEFVSGSLVIDTTTGDPDATAALGERLAVHGASYLDATLTGSSQVARAGELVVTAGGRVEDFQRVEPLFRMFARQWFHVGPWGSGARAKLVVNLVLGLNRAALAEGLGFARSCGLDLRAVLDILKSGAAYSKVMDAKGEKMIAADFSTEAKLAQHLKDVRLIQAAGARVGAVLPLCELHERLLAELVERGFGECDNSAVIRAFDGDQT